MATVADYKAALARATEAGDTEAIAHFQSQIDKGLAMAGAGGKPIPQGGSALLPILQGATFGLSDELAGLGGGLAAAVKGLVTGDPNETFSKGYDFMLNDMRQGQKEYGERHPYANMAAEVGGALAVPLGIGGKALQTATGGRLGWELPSAVTNFMAKKPLVTAIGTGALYGAGEGEGGVENRAGSAALGGLTSTVGYGLLRGATALKRAVIPPVATKATKPGFQAAVNTLEKEGLPVSPAEKIASPEGRMAERMAASYLGQPNAMEARPTQLYSKLMGYSGFHPKDVEIGELSAEAVNRASQRFNKRYDAVLKNTTVQLPDMDPLLARIERGFSRQLPFEQQPRLARIINDFRTEIAGKRTISGTDYKRLRSRLGTQARQAAKSIDPYTAPVYKALQSSLDDAFRTVVPSARADALRAVDADYGGYKILQELQRNPEAIGTAANRMTARGGSHPRQEFRDLLKAYQDALLRGYKQTSGTAENTVAKGLTPPVMPMARATGAKLAAATRNMRLPEPLQLPPGAGAFLVGEQSPDSNLEQFLVGTGKGLFQ